MSLTIIVLDGSEDFLQFLDPELCTLKETHTSGGLRTLELEYKFQDLHEDKQLFRVGNKIWIQGDTNLTDCLYVINTPVELDVYNENSFHMDIEEVLVELNYAPLFTQNELKNSNGFNITTTNGQQSVKVDWNALNYWFGDYYNIGVVQDCMNSAYNRISFNGTQTLMGLLRYIEEETGNVFVTRYEKDCLNNTIHRYLDFLNPIDVSKKWVLNIEYDFISEDTSGEGVFDENNNPTTDTYDDVYEEDDIVEWEDYTPITNLDPTTTNFRITNSEGLLLNSDGTVYTEETETPLCWTSEDIGLDGTEDHIVINLSMNHGTLGLICNNKSVVVLSEAASGSHPKSFVSVENDPTVTYETILPDDSYFEIYDTVCARPLFRTCINREIGHVHEQVLDFGFNLENVIFEIDEEDTYTAISPVLSLNESDGSNSLSRNDMADIITKFKGLSISKSATIPMILEKVTVKASSLAAAKTSLGTFNVSSNYWSRPYKPNDQIDSDTPSNSTWEFWRATAYWKAPFKKVAGQFHINSNTYFDNEYTTVYGRPDIRDDYSLNTPKMGTVETSDEDIYAIYNDVAMKLKEKMNREFNITVDVANLLRNGEFNNYELHDKVYLKLPDYNELITARVTKTEKEAHDVAKNTVELSNYTNNIVKNEPFDTAIIASNTQYKYPNSKTLTVRLENLDYDSYDEYSVHYPANKLLTFVLYRVENGQNNLTKKTYNKKTNALGYASINMRWDPGNYKLKIIFGGDEEYEDCSVTININVSGVKPVVKPVNTKNYKPKDLKKSKTTKKSTKNKQQVKRYYSKYGVSPDGKYLMAVGRPSATGELAKYGYKYYKTVFVRKCPFCGSKELYWNIFWNGNEYGSWGKNPAVGRQKSGSAEGEITCKKCDADFSIFGKDKATTARKNLKVYKKPVKVNKSDAYTLKKGKMYYDTITKTVKQKNVASNKERVIPGNVTVNEKVRQQALAIVGNSTGLAAAKKIAAWCGKKSNLRYDYYCNFDRQPSSVQKKRGANCCDSTRYMLNLMAAAGCMEKLKLEYVHVIKPGTNEGHVFAKITTKATGNWRYVDPVLKYKSPWGHWYKGCGTTIAQISTYPTLPCCG